MITAWLDDIEIWWDVPPTPTPTPTPGPLTASATAASVTWVVPSATAQLLDIAGSIALDNPKLWYRLGESSGDALDSSGNGYTGTRIGSPTLGLTGAHTDGAKSQDFDGVDDYIAGPNSQPIGGTGFADDFTVEFWARFTADMGPILNISSSAYTVAQNRNHVQIHIYPGSLWATICTKEQWAWYIGTDHTYIDSTWHHFVFRRDGSDWRWYVDGVLDGSGTKTVGGSMDPMDRTTVGTRVGSDGHSDHPTCRMQDLVLYDYALDPARIAVHALVGGPPLPQTRDAVAASAAWGVSRGKARLTPAITPTPVGGDPDVFALPSPGSDPDTFADVTPSSDPDTTTTDSEGTCQMNTTACVNVALSRIGVSKQIASFSADTSKEAVLARLHWGLDVNRVLRDFPWSFATKYHTMTPVIGNESEAANGDWQYGYQVPDDCVFVRRVIPPSGARRTYDEHPVVFRLGTTAAGQTLFTNQEPPCQIEYTYRYNCPAAAPDSHFRSALAWRLAASLVSPLARDAKLIDYCEQMYQRELKLAGAGQGNEQQMEKDGDASWISGRS